MDIGTYVAGVNALVRRGGIGEHSIRSALLPQIRAVAPEIEAINEPAATEHGNPDVSVYKSGVPIGWIETKALNTNLDNFERSEQFNRYLRGFSNLLVTNFIEFRWYLAHGPTPVLSASLGEFDPLTGIIVATDPQIRERVRELVKSFCSHESREARSAEELARRLANFAIVIRTIVAGIFQRHDDDAMFQQELQAFRAVLIPELPEADFADMYAQMVAYGLFAARCAHPDLEAFDRFNAPQLLPISNPFLRNVFANMAGANLDGRVAGVLDQICLLLRTADVGDIVEQFYTRTGLADPVVHFYETFLKTFDRDLRKDRGVYYTPLAVVSFIVRSADEALKRSLGVQEGLADASRMLLGDHELHRVQVLDPATGTGTFLLYLTDFLRAGFRNQAGLWSTYVREELLPRMHGFEILMAPYAIAHLKVGMALAGQGFHFNEHERLSVFLTNTLEDTTATVAQLPFQNFLTMEASQANEIKQTRPIMVVMGNPPYSVRTGNLGANARRLVSRYRLINGVPIREGGTLALQKSLENDYVKFLAFGQEQIERSGEGVVAYITANGYLDQPTLAGLRRSLMQSFDEIYIIDLHGYARAADDDENVFTQIGEGVAIILLVRRQGSHAREATVRYHSEKGSRTNKRAWLSSHHAYDISYVNVSPSFPDYLFRPEDPIVRDRYRREFVGLTEIFPLQRGAIVTARDEFAIAFTEAELIGKLEAFRDFRGSARQASEELGIKWSGDWPKMADVARDWLRVTPNLRTWIQPITYRPFDDRFVIYTDKFLDTPCTAVMDHMVKGHDNRLLLFGRSVRYGMPDQFFVTNKLSEAKAGEASRQCHAAPLYLFHEDLAATKASNISQEFWRRTTSTWGRRFSPEEIFGYVYGVLNSNSFREAYAQQLCAEYARIPLLPGGIAEELALLGKRLVDLHVGQEQPNLITTFPIAGPRNHVSRMPSSARWRSVGDSWQLWLNNEQYVGEIPDKVRVTRIAGYLVLDKWVGGRIGRDLSVAEIIQLQKCIATLSVGVDVVKQIDELIGPLLRN